MVRQYALQGKRQCFPDTVRNHLLIRIENHRRQMGETPIAREKIPAEQQAQLFAEISRMPGGVAREMDGPQTVPDIEEIAVIDPAIRGERLESQQGSANRLKQSSDPCPSAMGWRAFIRRRIQPGSGNPGPVLSRDSRHIEDVVKMPMGHDHTQDLLILQTTRDEGFPEGLFSADEPGINQIKAATVTQHMEVHREIPDGKQSIRVHGGTGNILAGTSPGGNVLGLFFTIQAPAVGM